MYRVIRKMGLVIIPVLIIVGLFYFKTIIFNSPQVEPIFTGTAISQLEIEEVIEDEIKADMVAGAETQVEEVAAPVIEQVEVAEVVADTDSQIKIKIIKTPRGEEPEWVKESWVGLEIPVIRGVYESELGQEILSKEFREAKNYVVPLEEALKVLKDTNPAAEKWWRRNVDLTGVDYLAFDQEVCELIKE